MSLFASTANGNTTHRAAVLTPGRVHYGNGTVRELRPGAHTDLGFILAGTLERFTAHSTVVLDGVPVGDVRTYPAGTLRRAGWSFRDIGAWSVFHRPGRTVAVGVRDGMHARFNHYGPLYGPDTDPGVMAVRLDRYAQATGYAWRGTFATTSLQAIRLTWENTGDEPRWNVPRVARLLGAGVLDWKRALTERETEWGRVHTFDAVRAYLMAAAGAELAWSELERTKVRPFDARIPGYWRLRLGEATRAGLADPLRPPILSKVDPDGSAWMTTPMAALVVELDPGCRVLDSYTGRPHKRHPAGVQLLRPWAFELREAFGRVAELGGDELLIAAVKRTYKDAVGGMQRNGMRVCRPDWAHTVIDYWRAWLYRRILAVRESQGVWPVRVHTDSVSYADSAEYPQSRGATQPYATLTDNLRVNGCDIGCGCSRGSTTVTAGFTHEASTDVAGWSP
jgi:hypothetical protein